MEVSFEPRTRDAGPLCGENMMPSVTVAPIAALVHSEHGEGDELLARFVSDMRERGWRVRGLLQQPAPQAQDRKQMDLVDIDSGKRFPLFQYLGQGSDACSVDTGSIAAASTSLRMALADGADLVVVNRFGVLEAAGGGFSIEMLAIMAETIPMLTLVAAQHLEEWRYFTGHAGVELPLRRDSLEQWFSALEPGKRRATA